MTRRVRVLAAIIVLAIVALAAGTPATRPSALAADPPPANDNFSSPQQIAPYDSVASPPMTFGVATTDATLEMGESAPCATIGATVWYVYQPIHDETVEISTAGSSFDTVLAVYEMGDAWYPSPPGANLRAAACNDDSDGSTSALTIAAERSVRYYIQAGGKNGAAGNLHLEARCIPACRPANDDYQDATWASVSAYDPQTTLTATSEHATLEAGEPRPCGSIGATVWFRLWMDSQSTVVVDTNGSDFDTVLAAYGPGGTFFPSPPGALSPSDCNDDSGGFRHSKLVIRGEPFSEYWLQVGGKNGATGQVTLNLACDPACPPFNDDIASAMGYGLPMSDQVNTHGATIEPGEPAPCGNVGRTVWYMVEAPANATIAVDTADSDFDTVVAAYVSDYQQDGVVAGDKIACSAGVSGGAARIEFSATAMTSYLIQAGGRNGASGELHVSIDCGSRACPPYNDSMSSYGYLFPGSWEFVDTTGATVEEGEAQGCGVLASTVWYVLQSYDGGGGRFRVSSTDSDYSTAIAVYRRRSDVPEAPLSLVACGDTAHPDVVEFDAEPESSGWQYLLQAGSRAGSGGGLQLRADCIPSCSVDVPSPPDEGHVVYEPATGVSGPITLPSTGSGGYLPGAR